MSTVGVLSQMYRSRSALFSVHTADSLFSAVCGWQRSRCERDTSCGVHVNAASKLDTDAWNAKLASMRVPRYETLFSKVLLRNSSPEALQASLATRPIFKTRLSRVGGDETMKNLQLRSISKHVPNLYGHHNSKRYEQAYVQPVTASPL